MMLIAHGGKLIEVQQQDTEVRRGRDTLFGGKVERGSASIGATLITYLDDVVKAGHRATVDSNDVSVANGRPPVAHLDG